MHKHKYKIAHASENVITFKCAVCKVKRGIGRVYFYHRLANGGFRSAYPQRPKPGFIPGGWDDE